MVANSVGSGVLSRQMGMMDLSILEATVVSNCTGWEAAECCDQRRMKRF